MRPTRNREFKMIESLSKVINKRITITDYKSSIIVPFGPVYSGKTMMLNRLLQYNHNFVVKLDRMFINSPDYQKACDDYGKSYKDGIPCATYMPILGKLIDCKGMCQYQFLDMPGEYLFDYNNPKAPSLLQELILFPNKKIWLILIELDWDIPYGVKIEYVKRIAYLKQHMSSNDKVIIIANKIDEIDVLQTNVQGTVNLRIVKKMIDNEYPGLFEIFKNRGLKLLWKPYNCILVPFSCGEFSFMSDGALNYCTGNKIYPQLLWNAIRS